MVPVVLGDVWGVGSSKGQRVQAHDNDDFDVCARRKLQVQQTHFD
jgi:hypothetical protein